MADHSKLLTALARLEAHRRQVAEGRAALRAEVIERRDAIAPALETVENHPALDDAGVLGHRYHRTLLAEHAAYDELTRQNGQG